MTKARDLADLMNKITPEEAIRLHEEISHGYQTLENLNTERGKLWSEIETLKNQIRKLDHDHDYALLQKVVDLQNDISHLGMALDDHPDDEILQEELDIRIDEYNQIIDDRIGRSSVTDVGEGEAYESYVNGTKIWTRMSDARREIDEINKREDMWKYDIEKKERMLPPRKSEGFEFVVEDEDRELPADWELEETEEDRLKMDLYVAEENERWQKIHHQREMRLMREQNQREIEAIKEQTVAELLEQSRSHQQTKDIKLDPEFAEDLERLRSKGDLAGKEIEVYLLGKHPKAQLALRYKISQSKLILRVRNKVPNEINTYECEFGPSAKIIQVAICVNKDDHFYARTFKRKEGKLWLNAERKYGPGSERIRNMTAYDLFQYHDRIEEYVQSKKKGQRI